MATGSGTSMACPHVAGVAALVFNSPIDQNYDFVDNEIWDAAEVRAKLQATADDLGNTGRDNWYGFGLVDAEKAAVVPIADTTPPVISNVEVSGLTLSSATITWTTNEPSDSLVNFGTSLTSLGNSKSDSTLVISHSVTLTDLTSETNYYFEVQSTDASTNTATDNNGGSYFMFTTLAPDTIPPSQVTGLIVTTVSDSQLNLIWTENTEEDLDHYDIYRSTFSGFTPSQTNLIAHINTNLYSDTALLASTTYYYKVSAIDTSNNEGMASDQAQGTTLDIQSTPKILAEIIEITDSTRRAGRNNFYWATATVKVTDATTGNVLEGATVYGYWESATSDSEIGTTDNIGEVSFSSDSVKNPSTATFTFVIDDVVLAGYSYVIPDPKTSASITIP